MAKITLPTFTSLTNESSFLTQLNAAMASIATFAETVLSRDGTTPNYLSADLDMNSFQILNLPAPVDDYDPVRLIDVAEGIQGPKGDPGADGADGGPLSDGDYTDITVSSSGTVFTIKSSVLSTVGRTLTSQPTQALMRTTGLGLGDCSTLNVGTTASTVADGNDTRFTAYTVNDQSGSTYTFATTDPGKLVRQTAASTHTYTINPYATTAIPVGSVIVLRNAVGAGNLTIARGSGVALYINGGTTSANGTLAAGGICTLVHEATNTWFAIGVGLS